MADNRPWCVIMAERSYAAYKKEQEYIANLKKHDWVVKQYENRNTYYGAKK